MDELVKAIKYFITRDVIFIIGGTTVIAAFLYRLDYSINKELPLALYFLIAGMGYGIGYALQDFFCIFPGITTSPEPKTNKFIEFLFKRFTRTGWRKIDKNITTEDLINCIYLINGKRKMAQHDRMITILQVGTTLGPCGLISGFLVFWKWNSTACEFDFFLSVVSIFISIILLILSRIKVAQYAQFLYGIYVVAQKKKENDN